MIDYTKLRKKLAPDQDGEPPTHLRTATVDAVNSDGTVDLLMASGVIVPDVPKLVGAYTPDGSVVQVISLRGSLLVIGAVSTGGNTGTVAASSTSALTFTNTSGTSGSPVVGVSFVAPSSGAVMISVGGNIWISSNTFRSILGWELKTGSTIDTGTVVKGPDYRYAIIAGRSVTTGGPNDNAATRRRMWSGLTPGSEYNVVTKHWVSGGTGDLDQREIIVEPAL